LKWFVFCVQMSDVKTTHKREREEPVLSCLSDAVVGIGDSIRASKRSSQRKQFGNGKVQTILDSMQEDTGLLVCLNDIIAEYDSGTISCWPSGAISLTAPVIDWNHLDTITLCTLTDVFSERDLWSGGRFNPTLNKQFLWSMDRGHHYVYVRLYDDEPVETTTRTYNYDAYVLGPLSLDRLLDFVPWYPCDRGYCDATDGPVIGMCIYPESEREVDDERICAVAGCEWPDGATSSPGFTDLYNWVCNEDYYLRSNSFPPKFESCQLLSKDVKTDAKIMPKTEELNTYDVDVLSSIWHRFDPIIVHLFAVSFQDVVTRFHQGHGVLNLTVHTGRVEGVLDWVDAMFVYNVSIEEVRQMSIVNAPEVVASIAKREARSGSVEPTLFVVLDLRDHLGRPSCYYGHLPVKTLQDVAKQSSAGSTPRLPWPIDKEINERDLVRCKEQHQMQRFMSNWLNKSKTKKPDPMDLSE
jgi:hypothetical protein